MPKKTHGLSRTPEFWIWNSMIQRCNNPDNQAYHYYGGRGITVCDRWKDSFQAFIDDMGMKPTPKHTLDREDNEKGYGPDNCRWVTRKVQQNNTRRNVKLYHNGRLMTISEISEFFGISRSTLVARLEKGMLLQDAIDEAVREARVYEYDGRKQTALAWSKEKGIAIDALRHRLTDLGWAIEKALTTPVNPRDARYEHDGRSLTLREWSNETGVDYQTLYARIKYYGWSLERALK